MAVRDSPALIFSAPHDRMNETQLRAKKVIRRHAAILIRLTANTHIQIKGRVLRVHIRHFQANMTWFTSDSSQASAWREVSAPALLIPNVSLMLLQLNGNTIRVVVTSALMTNAAVYHVRMFTGSIVAFD
jgi:hypothetical protein